MGCNPHRQVGSHAALAAMTVPYRKFPGQRGRHCDEQTGTHVALCFGLAAAIPIVARDLRARRGRCSSGTRRAWPGSSSNRTGDASATWPGRAGSRCQPLQPSPTPTRQYRQVAGTRRTLREPSHSQRGLRHRQSTASAGAPQTYATGTMKDAHLPDNVSIRRYPLAGHSGPPCLRKLRRGRANSATGASPASYRSGHAVRRIDLWGWWATRHAKTVLLPALVARSEAAAEPRDTSRAGGQVSPGFGSGLMTPEARDGQPAHSGIAAGRGFDEIDRSGSRNANSWNRPTGNRDRQALKPTVPPTASAWACARRSLFARQICGHCYTGSPSLQLGQRVDFKVASVTIYAWRILPARRRRQVTPLAVLRPQGDSAETRLFRHCSALWGAPYRPHAVVLLDRFHRFQGDHRGRRLERRYYASPPALPIRRITSCARRPGRQCRAQCQHLAMAQGICRLLDADDEWSPDFLEPLAALIRGARRCICHGLPGNRTSEVARVSAKGLPPGNLDGSRLDYLACVAADPLSFTSSCCCGSSPFAGRAVRYRAAISGTICGCSLPSMRSARLRPQGLCQLSTGRWQPGDAEHPATCRAPAGQPSSGLIRLARREYGSDSRPGRSACSPARHANLVRSVTSFVSPRRLSRWQDIVDGASTSTSPALNTAPVEIRPLKHRLVGFFPAASGMR